ncbi:hypothetical protein CSB09_02675 [Candidatus Gracilibacteria bacterium]|nr:MAG: hypothetical protein CSB09_02675 [Candidatus Gracilibacteria bacterium]
MLFGEKYDIIRVSIKFLIMKHISLAHMSYDEAMESFRRIIRNDSWVQCIIDFPADFSMSKIIRDMIGELFDHYSISKKWRGRFILIIDELINNSIEHGSKKGDENTCKIEAGNNKEGHFFIRFEVHDTGNGTGDCSEAQNNVDKAKKEAEKNKKLYMNKRGRGLFLITKKLVDSLDFSKSEKGGMAVKIEKTIYDT